MKKTANYALNQWDPADRILRTDFNDDNAKLDAAIMAVRAAVPVEKLLDVTIQTAAIQVDLDLSGIDLSPYSQLLAELIPSADTASQTHCYLRCNGVSTGYIRSADTASALASFSLGLSPDAFMGELQIFLRSGGLGCAPNYGYWTNSYDAFYCQGSSGTAGIRTINRANLQVLNFVCGDAAKIFGAGSRFIVRGVKF